MTRVRERARSADKPRTEAIAAGMAQAARIAAVRADQRQRAESALSAALAEVNRLREREGKPLLGAPLVMRKAERAPRAPRAPGRGNLAPCGTNMAVRRHARREEKCHECELAAAQRAEHSLANLRGVRSTS